MKFLIFAFLVVATFLISCSKNEDTPNPNPTSLYLVKSNYYSGVSTADFSSVFYYDNQNRLIGAHRSSGDSVILEYKSNQVTEKTFDALHNLSQTNVYFLNAQNLTDSAVEQNGFRRSKISYDSEGYIATQNIYDSNNTLTEKQTNVVQNGNIISITSTTATGLPFYSYTYSNFDLSRNNTIKNDNVGQSFKGKASKNFARRVEVINITGTLQFDYILAYDALDRIIGIASYKGPDKLADEIYTYY